MLDAAQMISLSFPMSPDSPVPPAIQPMEMAPRYQLAAGDEANVWRVTFDNHANTHVDAPAHVIADGLRIGDFGFDDLLFTRPAVVDVRLPDAAVIEPAHLEPHMDALRDADLLLLRLGYGLVRRNEPERYAARCPGFGVAGAAYLRQRLPGLRAVGMDVPSFVCIAHLAETMRAHHVMLEGRGRRCLLIEDMDLDKDLARLAQVLVVPWQLAGVDSAPCAVLGLCAGG